MDAALQLSEILSQEFILCAPCTRIEEKLLEALGDLRAQDILIDTEVFALNINAQPPKRSGKPIIHNHKHLPRMGIKPATVRATTIVVVAAPKLPLIFFNVY